MRRRTLPLVITTLLLMLAVPATGRRADTLPESLTDREFWSLIGQLSEPNGEFVSRSGSPDNLLSNEMQVSTVAAALAGQVKPASVYLGVGPEQNFTYIAAIKPRIAFVTDIRRGNLDVHLLYKALFEMSASRSELVARLFSRKPATGLARTSTAAQLMNAYLNAAPVDETTFAGNLKAILDLLTDKHGWALTADDRASIEHAYRAFHRFGPAINYTSSINGGRTFLASEENFALVKRLENRNVIVPVVGNFAGPKALRAIGAWLKARGATVSAFYVSNVEQYLQQNGVWPGFCANVARLPVDPSSIFIRPNRGGSSFASIAAETAACGTR
jgi:hypothetical protein